MLLISRVELVSSQTCLCFKLLFEKFSMTSLYWKQKDLRKAQEKLSRLKPPFYQKKVFFNLLFKYSIFPNVLGIWSFLCLLCVYNKLQCFCTFIHIMCITYCDIDGISFVSLNWIDFKNFTLCGEYATFNFQKYFGPKKEKIFIWKEVTWYLFFLNSDLSKGYTVFTLF